MARESVFTFEATPIEFGPGAAADAGWELVRLGVSRVLLVADPRVDVERVDLGDVEVVAFDGVPVEPTLDSLQAAADFALDAGVDGFVSVGGGSTIDTAKVADLIVSHPAPVMDYVNAPIGSGREPSGPLLPHLAIPTTSGTGSGGDHGRGAGHPFATGQDGHLASVPAPFAGDRRSVVGSVDAC